MRLVSNWRTILRRSWAVRLSFIAAAIDGLLMGWAAFSGVVPPMNFMVVALMLNLAVPVVRVLDQGIAK